MKKVGSVEVPQEAFMAVLGIGEARIDRSDSPGNDRLRILPGLVHQRRGHRLPRRLGGELARDGFRMGRAR